MKITNFLTETADWLRDKYSFSKLSTMAKCPRMAYNKYVLKKSAPPSFAALYGSGVHGGQEWDNLEKVEGRTRTAREVLAVATAEFEEKAKGADWTPGDRGAFLDKFVEEHKIQLIKFDESGERAKIKPVPGTIEEAFEIKLALPVAVDGRAAGFGDEAVVEGYVDVVSEGASGLPQDREIVDYKTAGIVQKAGGHMQLALEGLGAGVSNAKAVTFIKHARQKPTTKVSEAPVSGDVINKLMKWVADTITSFRRALITGDWPKCPPESVWCSAKACPYYRECYPSEGVVGKFVAVKDVKIVGTLPKQAWRASGVEKARKKA